MRYSTERKEAILKKMAPPMSMTIPELAEQEGVTATTLYNWALDAKLPDTLVSPEAIGDFPDEFAQ
ncbi:transposase [Cobetia sp. LC6]|uniref:transposase n=1 Tax=Cobetia sp. LC6 TaxID=3050947 RepID=UPI002557C075|nr:transposase [Cobetia sp. LC6]MDL2192750.1 transposase [Cobetia sp. LC6]